MVEVGRRQQAGSRRRRRPRRRAGRGILWPGFWEDEERKGDPEGGLNTSDPEHKFCNSDALILENFSSSFCVVDKCRWRKCGRHGEARRRWVQKEREGGNSPEFTRFENGKLLQKGMIQLTCSTEHMENTALQSSRKDAQFKVQKSLLTSRGHFMFLNSRHYLMVCVAEN